MIPWSAIIAWAAKNWRRLVVPALVLIAALGVLAGVIYVNRLNARVSTLTSDLRAAQATNAANLKAVAAVKANAEASARAVAEDTAAATARERAVADIKRTIYHAEVSHGDCTVVGPQLRAALDGLRKLQAGNAHSD